MTADSRPWFKVDVGYFSNPKVAQLLDDHPRAVVFHLECVAYAKQHRTDGAVPMRVAMRIACAEQCDVDAAVDAGLVERISEREVRAHDYEKHQGSADGALRRSDAAKTAANARWDRIRAQQEAEAMRSACDSHCDSQCDPHAEGDAIGNADKTRQDKTDIGGSEEPNHTEPKAKRRAPKVPLPDSWSPTDRHREYAAANRIDLGHEANRFRNNALAKDERYADWSRAFTNWLTNGHAKGWVKILHLTPTERQARAEQTEAPFVPLLKLHGRGTR